MVTALVNKVIPFSCVDGPGNRTAIFLQGCNFDCKYCHNPETIHRCVNCGACVPYCKPGALTLENGTVHYDIAKCVLCDECFHHCPHGSSPRTRALTAEQVMTEVRKNVPFIRGITVSGGECTRWPEFLKELFPLAREENLTCLLDSNGSYDFSADPALLAVTDGVMLDVKSWEPEVFSGLTGGSGKNVKKNLLWLSQQGKLEEVRIVCVPGRVDVEDCILGIADVLGQKETEKVLLKLIRFRHFGVRGELSNWPSPSMETMLEWKDLAMGAGFRRILVL